MRLHPSLFSQRKKVEISIKGELDSNLSLFIFYRDLLAMRFALAKIKDQGIRRIRFDQI